MLLEKPLVGLQEGRDGKKTVTRAAWQEILEMRLPPSWREEAEETY